MKKIIFLIILIIPISCLAMENYNNISVEVNISSDISKKDIKKIDIILVDENKKEYALSLNNSNNFNANVSEISISEVKIKSVIIDAGESYQVKNNIIKQDSSLIVKITVEKASNEFNLTTTKSSNNSNQNHADDELVISPNGKRITTTTTIIEDETTTISKKAKTRIEVYKIIFGLVGVMISVVAIFLVFRITNSNK